MSDLISRQAALDIIDSELSGWLTGDERLHLEGVGTGIQCLPTIDAVPVVRCKECKWWERTSKDSPIGYCHACKHAYMTSSWEIGIYRTHKPDFFCADGERSEK